jgi:hypothetical protein
MVERFWGLKGVYAQDFRALVREEEGGIRFSDLADELSSRGWQVTALRHAPEETAGLVRQGFPVIALLKSGPGGFHYVVVVGWTARKVTFHDPSSAPLRTSSGPDFMERWAASGFRGLLLRPPPTGPPELGRNAAAGESPPDVSSGGAAPRAASPTSDSPGSGAAGPDAPGDALRESRRAFEDGRYEDGATLAAGVARGDPNNTHALRLLAANRYLDGRPLEALSAWNGMDRPAVDLIRLKGNVAVNHRTVLSRLGVQHQEILTPEKLSLVERRVSLMPGVEEARPEYTPNEDGSVELVIHLLEPSSLPTGWIGWSSTTLEALFRERIHLTVPGFLDEGEAVRLRGRWQRARPMIAVDFSTPASVLPGVTSVTGTWARERYSFRGRPSEGWMDEGEPRVEWSGIALKLTEWIRHDVRAGLTVRLDRWKNLGRYVGLGTSGLAMLGDARFGLQYDGTMWIGGRREGFHQVHLEARWRSTTHSRSGWRLEARSGLALAGSRSPRNLWPGAGVGLARPYLLRARPLLEDGGVRLDGLARGLWFGGAELLYRGSGLGLLRFEPGVFSDAGRLWDGPTPTAFQLDVGILARMSIPGFGGWLQLSAARGVYDGAGAVTVTWVTGWWPE